MSFKTKLGKSTCHQTKAGNWACRENTPVSKSTRFQEMFRKNAIYYKTDWRTDNVFRSSKEAWLKEASEENPAGFNVTFS